jgi:hypothetical protein
LVALLSCDAGQESFEHPDLGHGLFFRAVIDGWNGRAVEPGKPVTLDDLRRYVRRETRELARAKLNAVQTPVERGEFRGADEWVLREPAATGATEARPGRGDDASPELPADLAPLVADLRGRNAKVRLAALAKLGEAGPAAAPALGTVVEFGVLDPNPAVREAATAALERIDNIVHREVVTILYDANWGNRLNALKRLVESRADTGVKLPLAKHVYRELAARDGDIGTYSSPLPQLLDTLIQLAPDDRMVIEAVVRLAGDTRLDKPLAPAPYRAWGIERLNRVSANTTTKVTLFTAALGDPRCRHMAIKSLGEIGPPARSALPLLNRLKFDGDAKTREAAAAAVSAIQG